MSIEAEVTLYNRGSAFDADETSIDVDCPRGATSVDLIIPIDLGIAGDNIVISIPVDELRKALQ